METKLVFIKLYLENGEKICSKTLTIKEAKKIAKKLVKHGKETFAVLDDITGEEITF